MGDIEKHTIFVTSINLNQTGQPSNELNYLPRSDIENHAILQRIHDLTSKKCNQQLIFKMQIKFHWMHVKF